MKRIQSKLHKIATYESCFDDKRYILDEYIEK